jgi:hypothetical protein
MSPNRNRLVLLAQLGGTLAILAWAPGNLLKTLLFLALWGVTFYPVSRRELVFYGVVSAFFSVLDIMSVSQGVFLFHHPDFLGLPLFEFFMWGFYLLHGFRMLGGPVPRNELRIVIGLTALFAIPFVTIPNQQLLTCVAGGALIIALVRYHQRWDFTYVAFFILLGTVVESVGVASCNWGYPEDPSFGVPLWFAIMWGGVGLFARRLFMRAVYPEHVAAAGAVTITSP